MPITRADFVQETTTTTGTGAYSLGGVAATNRRTFVAGNGAGATVRYAVTDGTDFEVCEGVITDATPDTLTRGTVLASSNGGSAVNWGAGSKTVSQVMTAGELTDMQTAIDGKAATGHNHDSAYSATGHNHSGTYQPLAQVLTDTTAAFTSAQEAKLGYVSVTQPVDLDAIETRVNALDSSVILKGVWDASAGTFPGGGTAQAGESWIVSVGGTVNSVVFAVNDRIIAITDNASTTTFAANWFKADYTDVFQTNAEIETAYNAQVAAASQAEMEAGTEAAIRRMSPLRVAQAIAALGGAGGGDMVKISTSSLAGLANKDFALSSTYTAFRLVVTNMTVNNTTIALAGRFSTDGGTSWKTGSTDYVVSLHKISDTTISATLPNQSYLNLGDLAMDIYGSADAIIDIQGANLAANVPTVFSQLVWRWSGATMYRIMAAGFIKYANPGNFNCNAFRLMTSGGAFVTSTVTLYGIK